MSDLVVKFLELEDSQAALTKIIAEFKGADSRVDGLKEIWSNGHVEDAMHSFATNWKDHRAKLLNKMEEAQKHSKTCLDSWLKADKQLAHAIEKQHKSNRPGS